MFDKLAAGVPQGAPAQFGDFEYSPDSEPSSAAFAVLPVAADWVVEMSATFVELASDLTLTQW